ncbi:ABC transporter permease [Halegenticoccus tardaugens]|uniref:ABC transporter permease n=1 Tax=Halegenticoccus tardaugens TaxID=2071624 RepID=UPI00100B4DB5|nr:ABC transporter permease subunit [Halegenticoccus tardaugens]
MEEEHSLPSAGQHDRVSVPRRLEQWAGENVGTAFVVVLLLCLWEIYSQLFNDRGDIYFPSIEYTVRQTVESSGIVLAAIQVTFVEVLVGFALAVVLGTTLGIIIAESFVVRYLSMPALIYTYGIPHPILAPVFLLWFGLGLEGVVTFAAWVAFFPTFINTVSSLSRIDPEYEKFRTIVGAGRFQHLRYIKFWTALPDIINGVKITFQLTIVGAIIAEFLGGGSGLGYLIIQSTQRAQLGLTFGIIILIALFASVLFKLLSLLLDAFAPHKT